MCVCALFVDDNAQRQCEQDVKHTNTQQVFS